MRIQKILQSIIVLIVVCSAKQTIDAQIMTMNINKAEEIFLESFCSDCKINGTTCSKNIKYISSLPETGNFNLSASPISKNPYNITIIGGTIIETNQTYRFPNRVNYTKSHKTLIYFPVGIIRGALLYYHATSFGKWGPPSMVSKEYQAIGSLFASQGYAVVLPDLLGFLDDPQPHPYILYPEISVRSAVSSLNQLESFFKTYGQKTISLYVAGYSEGGSYSAWFSKCISYQAMCPYYTLSEISSLKLTLSKYYNFKGAIAMDGALDLSGVMYKFLTKQVGVNTNQNQFMIKYQVDHNFAKGPLIIEVLASYLVYSLNKTISLENFIDIYFFLMNCNSPISQSLCNIDGTRKNISAALISNQSSFSISKAIAFSSFSKKIIGSLNPFLGSTIQEYTNGEINSVLSLCIKSYLEDNTFQSALRSASIIDYAYLVNRPLLIFTLKFDSVVTGNNSRNFKEKGNRNPYISFYQFENDNFLVCDGLKTLGVDHFRGQMLANIFALNFMEKNK